MDEKKMTATVLNVSKGDRPYVVARVSEGKLWYWGRWDDYDKALEVAKEIDGVILIDEV
jgi:hypothetical protein